MRMLSTLAVMTLVGTGAAAPAAELSVGDKAPDFKLAASDGKTYHLADFTGKKAVVVAWFPKAFTGGCTIECKSLAANGDRIRKYDVAYFMASVDPIEGEKGNKAFAASEKADFPMLSDPTKEVATAYGVLNAERGVANRWTFYIDKAGKIVAIDKAVKPPTSAEETEAPPEWGSDDLAAADGAFEAPAQALHGVLQRLEDAAEHAVLDEHLHALCRAGGELAPALHGPQVIGRDRPPPQRLEEEVGRGDGILDGQVDADAADGGHRMSGVADAEQAGTLPLA